MDRTTGTQLLVDTRAKINVLPPSLKDSKNRTDRHVLRATNSSSISSFILCSLTLDLGLCRAFHWIFMVANIGHPILASDFLSYFNLDVSMRQHRLQDNTTCLIAVGELSFVMSAIVQVSEYQHISANFLSATKPCNL